MTQDHIKQYYHLQHESFCDHIKNVVDALERILELEGDHVTKQQRDAVRGLKTLYTGQIIEDIKNDLASDHVTMDTVENEFSNNMKTIMLVFGTRPEAIKMCPLVKEFQKHPEEFKTIDL